MEVLEVVCNRSYEREARAAGEREVEIEVVLRIMNEWGWIQRGWWGARGNCGKGGHHI